MKLSGVLRAICIAIFWSAIGLFVFWFFELKGKIPAVIIMSAATALSGIFARIPKKKGFAFLFHLIMLAIPGAFAVTKLVGIPVMFYGMAIVAMSYIMKLAESNLMDRGNLFGDIVLVALYLVGSLMEYDYIWAHFCIMVLYIFLVYAEGNLRKSEDYLEKVSYHAVVDIKKISGFNNMFIIGVATIMFIVCVAVALLGKIPPLQELSALMWSFWKYLFKFVKRIKYMGGNEASNNDIEVPGNPFDDGEVPPDTSEQYIDVAMNDIIALAFMYAAFITIILYGIYRVFKKIYAKYLKDISEGVLEEHISIVREKTEKINPAKEDKSYSNRKAIRKIYKKRIKGKRNGRREDLYNCTPMEQRNKSNLDGNEIPVEMIDMYEKARYSNEDISKYDVKAMKNM